MSKPLRDLAANPPTVLEAEPRESDEIKVLPLPSGFKPASEPDVALQKTAATLPVELTPTVSLNFEGLGSGFPSYKVNAVPPDTNGAVGANQYVQWVNLSFAVFDKATGNVLPNFPVPGNTLWQGFGGGCETNNDGHPIVTYDKLADRWVFTQLAVRGLGTLLQCVAVSTSSDATGAYNRYSFEYANLNDDPKLGVWPDAYYITFNVFDSSGSSFLGAQACAYDRNAMLNGQAAKQVCFPPDPSVVGLLPADVDGLVPPPAGSPNFMVSFDVNSLKLFKFHVDFRNPANSTLSPATNIPVTPFTPFLCNGGTSFACVPQPPPGSGTLLDSLGDRLMYRLAYRNFGNHESLVVNHSVIADPVKLNSGIRWYEIQNPSGTPTVAQQSTFAPDANFRWMGSAAMDVSGDLAVGYSVSSAALFPSIAVAARASNDPASTLQAETTVFSGTGSQTTDSSGNPLTRWGDYSAMQVDPVDDCTFWYTTEYLAQSGIFNWNTRIANFKFPTCGVPLLRIALSHSGNFTQGQSGASYTINITNHGAQPTDGTAVTVTGTLPTGLTSTAASGTGWTCPTATGSAVSCNRTDALAAGASFPPITVTVNVDANAIALVTNTATVSGGGDKDFVHNTASDPITIIQTGPDLGITKTHSGPFIQGQTGTYTLTVSNVGLSSTDGTKVTVTDSLPTGLTFNAAGGTGWSCVAGPPMSCTRSDVLAAGSSYPAITMTVNVAANAPALVVNTASVAGGGDVNPLNDNASDPSKIIPPPPDLTITKTHNGNFNQGQSNAQYVLTVSNLSGNGPTTGTVSVKDTLPTGLTLANIFGAGWSCNLSTVTCTRSDVLPVNNGYPPITVLVNVASNAPASVVNSATVSGGGDITPGNDTTNDTTAINAAPDLTVTKSHMPDPFVVGQTGTYTITVSNVGNAPTTGLVTVNDSPPGGLSVTNVSGTGWSCNTGNSSLVNCVRIDTLAAGSSYPALTVTVNVNGGPLVTNTVSVSGGGEFNTANDTASDLTHVTAPALAITKTHTGNFTVGVPGVYTINVSNTGPIATSGTVTVTDNLPVGMTATGVSANGWNCNGLPTPVVTCSRSDSLGVGATYPALNVTVDLSGATATVTNSASVTGGGDLATHVASDSTNVDTPTLAVTKTHSGNFAVGQTGIYQITVSNTGKAPTVGVVTLQDNLPLNSLTAVALGGPGWNCSIPPTNSVTCTRPDPLLPGASYPALILTVNVLSASSTVTNTVTVSGGGDANTHSVSDTANVSGPTLSIAKSHLGTFTVGQTGTYTISVSNVGATATTGTVSVQDSLPPGMTATAVTGAGWNCGVLPTQSLNCTRSDSLSAGSSYPIMTITVSVATSGAFINSASVTGGGDSANHLANDPTTVIGPSLIISKSHTGNFTVGQNGTYTVTVTNTGQSATTSTVTVQDTMPSGFTVTAISGAGWNCNPLPSTSLTCTRADALNGGSSYPALVVTVSVNGGAPRVTNTASVTGGGGDTLLHSASDSAIVIGPSLGITESHSPDPFVLGQTGTYTISVDNNAGQTATAGTVTVQDTLPQGVTALAISGANWSCNTPPTAVITCTRSDTLNVGGSYPPITVTMAVNTSPFVTNTANVSGGGDSLTHSVNDTTKVSGPVLSITMTHSPDPISVGTFTNYTITVGNTGSVATTGQVTVTDVLPNGLTATPNGIGWACSGTLSVTCTRSDSLAAGQSYPPVTLTTIVNAPNPPPVPPAPPITNIANVTGGGDSLTHSATDTSNLTAPFLAIAVSHTGSFMSGPPVVYTITVSNLGSLASLGQVVVQDLPPAVASSASAFGWGCNTLPDSFLTCSRTDPVQPGGSFPPIQLTESGVLLNPGSFTFTDTATVRGGSDPLTHTAIDSVTFNPPTPALGIAVSHSGTFTVGQPANYTITVSNTSTAATNSQVTVTDNIPSGFIGNTVSGVGWFCSFFPSFRCFRSDSLPGGATFPPITLSGSIDPNATNVQNPLLNQVTVGGGGDPNFHTATDVANFNFASDLAIALAHNGNFFVGQTGATYTITVSNVGSIATTRGVTVIDPLPIGLTAAQASGTGWGCNIFSGPRSEVQCGSPATLAPGSSFPPLTITANVALSAPATLTNTATFFGIGDANFANDTASDTATISQIAIGPASSSTVRVTAGSSGTFSFQLNLGTNPPAGTATFSLTGLPPNSTFSFSPSSLSQTGTLTLTVNTSGNGHVASLKRNGPQWPAPIYAAAVLLPVFGFLALCMRGKKGRRLAWLAIPFLGVVLVMSFTSCGGGGGGQVPTPTPTPTPTPPPSTPPGSYTMTVTATSPSGSASTPVTLVVQ